MSSWAMALDIALHSDRASGYQVATIPGQWSWSWIIGRVFLTPKWLPFLVGLCQVHDDVHLEPWHLPPPAPGSSSTSGSHSPVTIWNSLVTCWDREKGRLVEELENSSLASAIYFPWSNRQGCNVWISADPISWIAKAVSRAEVRPLGSPASCITTDPSGPLETYLWLPTPPPKSLTGPWAGAIS